ncbi:MAG: 30S ribosomal protein S20 [Bacteroidetes bacterium]|jgi:small subunit ribosomal protein S20|nr:30S ribosomal protein S20 [Bacteroidota bacterium]
MPQHKSAEKRVRQSAKRAVRNKAAISKMRTLVKKVRSAKTKVDGAAALKTVGQYLDRLGAKGVIKKNMASNQKSRLAKFVNKLA